MGNVYFFTGFPGYLSTYLMKELFQKRYFVDHIYVLVLPPLLEQAKQSIHTLTEESSIPKEKITIISGDITKDELDIEADILNELKQKVTHVFHLAAIYDLAVPFEPARRVNVLGTSQINTFVKSLSTLKRYVYFSTAFVAGKRQGIVYENELEHDSGFNNHYEATKYEAELLVENLKNDVPVTIIRPGIVVGHSQTGETLKFDGPYFILNLIRHLRYMPIHPNIGKGSAKVNIVPLDYLIEATIYLGHLETNKSQTYHITDPNPYQARELYAMFLKSYLGKKPRGMVPHKLAELGLSIPFIRKWLQVEKESLDYFNEQTLYDSTIAQKDLADSGIACPDLKEVIPNLVDYYRKFEKDEKKHIHIS
jgi:thioester reductase-like protein